jgi:hypothetical protein
MLLHPMDMLICDENTSIICPVASTFFPLIVIVNGQTDHMIYGPEDGISLQCQK